MKINNPYDKDSLSIKKHYKVLEVGPGNNPTRRANTVIEKFVDDNYHRNGDFKIFSHQTLIQGDGENLPIRDKEFDYIICSHVLEHVEDPEKFVGELSRVAGMGYIETPSLIGEFLAPKISHKWVILEIDKKLVLYEKSKLPSSIENDYGNLFLNYLPTQSLPYRLLLLSRVNFLAVRYEWKSSIDIIVNPQDEYLSSFFIKKWTPEMVRKIFPPSSGLLETFNTFKAFVHFSNEKLKRVLLFKEKPLEYKDYNSKFSHLSK